MSENAPPPIGHHSDWLPFIAAVELALRQLGDPVQAMDAAISAVDSWVADVISARESWVPALVVVRGVRRLMTGTDKLKINYPAYWDDEGRQRLAKEWRDERRDENTVELITNEQGREHREPVLLFLWRPRLEEFLGLRPAAAREAKEPSEPVAQPEPEPEPQPESQAATPEQKSAKPRTTVQHTLTVAALDYLREKRPDKYSSGFAGARATIVESQMRPIWTEVCKAEAVSPDDYPLPSRDMITRAMKKYRVRD